ncbi:aminodeoxychorismate synthase component I [bacterium]|nr:aminodeoxychorismate synthase component I [bacterium]
MYTLSAIPNILEIDFHLTAERAFDTLRESKMPFWLDSAMRHGSYGRWSYVGCDPFLTFSVQCNRVMVRGERTLDCPAERPFEMLRELLASYRIDSADCPIPFTGGAVGFFGYDMGQYLETLPLRALDDLHLPDCVFGFYDVILAFDHQEEKSWVVSTGFPETDRSQRENRAKERAAWMLALLREAAWRKSVRQVSSAGGGLAPDGTSNGPQAPTANFTPDQYQAAVERVRQYIIAGDVFEVNLSQCFSIPIAESPVDLYRRLREINPAPFACYLGYDDFAVVSSSPERFLAKRGSLLESRPIKGTRKRGGTADEDRVLEHELLSSAKDRAENIMIVDLVRNDLGRVCDYGSVRVTGLAELERFPSVLHLTSTVQGRLRESHDLIDAIGAMFPGGSITGAPKIRSIEIIDELEPTRRGVYTGAIGWLGFNGDCDLNIAIRTMVVKDGVAHYQAGGAIIYDSDPESEYLETLHKAKALTEALRAPTGETS